MTRPGLYLLRMLVFLVVVGGIAYWLHPLLLKAFYNNPLLNGVIGGVLLLGILYCLWQPWRLGAEVRWIDNFRSNRQIAPGPPPQLLAPMATMLGEKKGEHFTISATAMRTLLDGIGSRLDETREISRYAIGLLIFLGLLGTFWGLLETIAAVGDAIANIKVGTGSDAAQMFASLKSNIEGPLKGMGTAFGCSLFGLAGSLVLGFLDLQVGQAQNRFFNELEEWLSSLTRLSSGALSSEGEQPLPAYVEALLEQSAESLEKLQRTLARSEEGREAMSSGVGALAERLSALSETMRAQQTLLVKLAENSIELKQAMAQMGAARPAAVAHDDVSRQHLRNVETYMARLLEEQVRSRTALADDLRGEFKLLARTIAGAGAAAARPTPQPAPPMAAQPPLQPQPASSVRPPLVAGRPGDPPRR